MKNFELPFWTQTAVEDLNAEQKTKALRGRRNAVRMRKWQEKLAENGAFMRKV